jgi:serine/threonine protein kinase
MHIHGTIFSCLLLVKDFAEAGNGVSMVRRPVHRVRVSESQSSRVSLSGTGATLTEDKGTPQKLRSRESLPEPNKEKRFAVDSLEDILVKGSFESSDGTVAGIHREPIGEGHFAKVYRGILLKRDGSEERVAIKFEVPTGGPFKSRIVMPRHYAQIEYEYDMMKRMEPKPGFPKIFAHNFSGKYKYYIMQYIGKSLDTIRLEYPNYRIPLTKCLRIARRVLERIRAVHQEGFVVYDIHPGNFLLDKNRKVYMIDLSFAFPWKQGNGLLIEDANSPFNFKGTRLSPLATKREENGQLTSRADDIQRFLYMLLVLLNGHLPWQDAVNDDRAKQMKLEMTPSQLCEYMDAIWLTSVLEKVSKLPFNAEPPYDLIDSTLEEKLIAEKQRKLSRSRNRRQTPGRA